ncbi:hypothetical protein Trydic_g14615 [Trypoxylus dichotomus]
MTEYKEHHSKDRKVIFFQYTIHVKSEVDGRNAVVHVSLKRCSKREAPDTCEHFANLNLKAPCRLATINSEFYTPPLHCLRPKVICPLKKGIYRGVNCSLNMDAYNLYPLISDYYWYTKIVGLTLFVNKVNVTCPEFKNKNLPVTITEFKVNHANNRKSPLFQFTVNVTSEIDGRNAIIYINLTRCFKREAPDTCENFAHLNLKEPCRLASVATEFYSPIIHCLKPRVRCPLKQGIYRGVNCPLNMDAYNLYPYLLGYYWNTKVVGVNAITKDPWHCSSYQGFAKRVN